MINILPAVPNDPREFVDWTKVRDGDPARTIAEAVDRLKVRNALERSSVHLSTADLKNTCKAYCSDAAQFLAWCVPKGLKLTQITHLHITQYIGERRVAEVGRLSPRSINRNLAAIQHLFNAIVEAYPEMNENHPVKRRHFFRGAAQPRPRPLVFRAAMAFLSKMESLTDRAVFAFMLFTGCRECELDDIRFSDTKLPPGYDKKLLQIHIRKGKGCRERDTYIAGPGLSILHEYLQAQSEKNGRLPLPNDLLLTNHAGLPWKPRRIRKRFTYFQERLRDVINTDGWTPHRFRHTLLSAMGEADMSIFAMQAISGHMDLNSLLHYVETQESKTRAAYHLAARKLCE